MHTVRSCRTLTDPAQWYILTLEREIINGTVHYAVKRYCPGRKFCKVTEEGLRRYLAIATCEPFNRDRERFREECVEFAEPDLGRTKHLEETGVLMLSWARMSWDVFPGLCFGTLHRMEGSLKTAVGGQVDLAEERLRLKKEIVAAAAVRVPAGRRKLVEDLRETSALWIKRQEKYVNPWEKKVADGLGRAIGHMADAVEGSKENDAFHAAYHFQRAIGNAGGFGVVRCNPLAPGKLPKEKPPTPRKRGRPPTKDCESCIV